MQETVLHPGYSTVRSKKESLPKLLRKEHSMDGKKARNPLLFVVVCILGLLFVVGCATRNYRKDYSSLLISQGERAVAEAKAGNASSKAQPELTAAEEKLRLAKEAFAREEHDKAATLAEEAKAAAEYAQSKASTEKTKEAVAEMQKNIETLRQDIGRQSK